jgi:hypothetical protein
MDSAMSDFKSLAARVEKLEKQNQRFKRGGLALILLASTAPVFSAPPSNPVIVLSGKIALRRCIFKKSVKVFTPKSPALSDDSASDFATF